MKRFEFGYDEVLASLTDEELAARINGSDVWDVDAVRELCWRADITQEEWDASETCEDIVYKAAKILGVEVA